MDTIQKGRFKSMNKLFKPPKISSENKKKNIDLNLIKLTDKLKSYKWDNKKSTRQMLEDNNHGMKDIENYLKNQLLRLVKLIY